MTNKEAKRDARAVKQFNDIVYRGHKVASIAPKKPSQGNRKGGGLTDAKSEDALAQDYIRLLGMLLPGVLVKLSELKDSRKESMCTHTIEILIIYGLIMFLSHMPSRRAANREIGGNATFELIRNAIPELTTMPHADTLARLLEGIDAEELEASYENTLVEFIKSKAFLEINPGRCLIAIDGTQKFTRKYKFADLALVYSKGDEAKERYSSYVLESVLILENKMVLPLFSEFLENSDGELDDSTKKQDCELKAFTRLTNKIEKYIGKGRVTLVVDGLYANGPVVSRCKALGWDYMITLRRGSLQSVWEDYDGLRKCEPENTLQNESEGRHQTFNWSNKIEYTYGGNHKRLYLNVVTCREEWDEERPRSGKKRQRKVSEYAWLSSAEIDRINVLSLCNMIARNRWRIENHFHVEKNQGYGYSHCFSYNWNAMKAFQSLMKFAHFINTLIANSMITCEYVASQGTRWFIKKVWDVLRYRGVRDQPAQVMFNKGRRGYRDIKLKTS
jgi:hypothetical protein